MERMSLIRTLLMLGLVCVPAAGYGWQRGITVALGQASIQAMGPVRDSTDGQQQDARQTRPVGEAAAQEPPAPPSTLLRPTLDALKQTIDSVKLEKWKGGSVRAEAASNIASIQKDVQNTLPAMLDDADAAPVTISKMLPVSRNIDALYAVLLRVVDGSRVAAPGEQVGQLQQAIADLEKARRAFDRRIEDMAAAQQKQISDLQVALKNPVVPPCPAVEVTPPKPAAPAHKAVKKKKPAATPPTPPTSSSPAANPAQTAPAKPN